MQTNQQTNRLAQRTHVRAVAIGQLYLEPIPIDLVRHNEQWVILIQQLLKLSLKQIQLARFRPRFRLHACPKLQGFDQKDEESLQF